MHVIHTASSKVKNSAQISSCQLKVVLGGLSLNSFQLIVLLAWTLGLSAAYLCIMSMQGTLTEGEGSVQLTSSLTNRIAHVGHL
jgi:hypothetical protein